MKCPNCTSEIDDEANFCDACGQPVNRAPKTMPLDLPVEEPAFVNKVPDSVTTPPGGKAFLGIDQEKMGLVSLITGIASVVLSCVGCGGLTGIAGVIIGIMALKSPNRQQGMIGLILSGLAVIIGLIVACIGTILLITSANNGGYYYY